MALQEEMEKQGMWLFKYRGTLPLIILAVGIVVFLQTRVLSGGFPQDTEYAAYYDYLCLLISLLGLVVRIYTVGRTPANTSGRNASKQVADTLNTTGIYSVVRHPLYLGNFLMWLGPALLSANLWFIVAFCLSYWVYYERIMFAEEQFLRRKFGETYTLWAEKVPAFFPRFKNFRKSDLPFSWKKILKKEKNGLVAIFMVFFIFDLLRALTEDNFDLDPFFTATFGFTFILYLVLKFLKNKTSVLKEARV